MRLRTSFGDTPAHLAAKYGHREALKALMVAGSDPTVKNYDDFSVYTIATGECKALLLEYYDFDNTTKIRYL